MPSPTEYRNRELEEDAISRVARTSSYGVPLAGLALVAALVFLAWLFFSWLNKAKEKNDDSFNTTEFNAPVIGIEPRLPNNDVGIIQIPPAAPPQVVTPEKTDLAKADTPVIPAVPVPNGGPINIVDVPVPPLPVAPGVVDNIIVPQAPGGEQTLALDAPPLPPQPPAINAPRLPQAPAQKQVPQSMVFDPEVGVPPVPPQIVIPLQPVAPPPEPKPVVIEKAPPEKKVEDKWARLSVASIILDDSKDDNKPEELTAEQQANAEADKEEDSNLAFLNKVGKASVVKTKAEKIARVDALVPQGTLIRGILETAINSDLAGSVRAVTREDVYSFDGRRVLIPSGTTLYGDYKSGIENGQTRVFIVWTRLLRADGVSVQLGSPGTDNLGQGGMAGYVDNHYAQRYGAAVALSLVGGATEFLSNWGFGAKPGVERTTTRVLPDGTVVTETQQVQSDLNSLARQSAADRISESLNTIADDALKANINIPPTIHVDQGEEIIVFLRRDLDFSALYPDPVIEELRKIKRERQSQNGTGVPQ